MGTRARTSRGGREELLVALLEHHPADRADDQLVLADAELGAELPHPLLAREPRGEPREVDPVAQVERSPGARHVQAAAPTRGPRADWYSSRSLQRAAIHSAASTGARRRNRSSGVA